MRDELIGRVLRALRHRKGWRQQDVTDRSGIGRSVISDLEAGRFGRHALDALREAVAAVDGVVRISVQVPGSDMNRLLDADHAQLQEHWKRWLERHGWTVHAEVTFNHFGERGSIDLLAWHAVTATLLVIEIKSVIVDVQHTLASIDRKLRISRGIARERGWRAAATVPALLVLEGSTARRRLAAHGALFGRFALRGRPALAWLRRPIGVVPTGVLCLTKLSDAGSGDRRRAGRRRVRLSTSWPRSAEPLEASSGTSPAVQRRQDGQVTANPPAPTSSVARMGR